MTSASSSEHGGATGPVQDQSEVIAFLSSPSHHPGKGPVDLVQTHGALVFLAGDVAIKVKRAVRYDYMDLSTLDRRKAMLRRELELNRATAPRIYQEVVPITREPDGQLALGGSGEPVEWALRMWRFPADAELSVIADAAGIGDRLAADLGDSIHAYHDAAPRRGNGGARLMDEIRDELLRAFAGMAGPLGADRTRAFDAAVSDRLTQIAPLLDRRAAAGKVRRCHGDLHLRNLVLLDGKPVPFDALEFDEVLGTCDVLYDLAFLLMDLRHRKLARAANIVLATYLLAARGDEDSGLAALPLFLSIRAAIRAMVLVQTARAGADDGMTVPEARRFLDDAIGLLDPPAARLVAVGGLSGSGKTTVARALAPSIGAAPGAVHLRTDLERKALAGVAAESHLPASSYSGDARQDVYGRCLSRAETILRAGHSVLLDATFLDRAERQRAEALAGKVGVPFAGLWLNAPPETLLARVNERAHDASDADAAVVRRQLGRIIGPVGWHRVDSGAALSETVDAAKSLLGIPGARDETPGN